MKVGDKIEIVNYGCPDDIELIQWAEDQDTDVFTVVEIDHDIFYINNCEYGIPFDSIDYKKV